MNEYELPLEYNEGIILQETHVIGYGSKKDTLEELLLTNFNLIFCYKHKESVFAKPENKIIKIPLENIKVIDGKAQVMKTKDESDADVLQILYNNSRRDHIYFHDGKRKLPIWANAINSAVTGNNEPLMEVDIKKQRLWGEKKAVRLTEMEENIEKRAQARIDKEEKIQHYKENVMNVAGGLKSVMEKAKSTINTVPITSNTTTSVPHEESCVYMEKKETSLKANYCSNCGTKLIVGAKFCSNCGTSTLAEVSKSTPPPILSQTTQAANNVSRQQEFIGKVYKCSNCGSVIGRNIAICPDCGIRITGSKAISSVQEFNEKLMAIEAERKVGLLDQLLNISGNSIDLKKLALIKSFPIPNTVEDIQEFMVLAMTNIDSKLSKNTKINKMAATINASSPATESKNMPATISNAWVAKMQQVYMKAKISFPNDPAFEDIEQMYLKKLRELKIKPE